MGMWWLQDIEKALKKSGLSASEASRRATGSPNVIRDMRAGREPGIDRYKKLCNVLGVDFYTSLPSDHIKKPKGKVPLWGNIAAGGNDSPTDGSVTIAEDTALDSTTAPAHLTPQDLHQYGGMLALTVQGASMQPAYHDGDTIYIYI